MSTIIGSHSLVSPLVYHRKAAEETNELFHRILRDVEEEYREELIAFNRARNKEHYLFKDYSKIEKKLKRAEELENDIAQSIEDEILTTPSRLNEIFAVHEALLGEKRGFKKQCKILENLQLQRKNFEKTSRFGNFLAKELLSLESIKVYKGSQGKQQKGIMGNVKQRFYCNRQNTKDDIETAELDPCGTEEINIKEKLNESLNFMLNENSKDKFTISALQNLVKKPRKSWKSRFIRLFKKSKSEKQKLVETILTNLNQA